MVTLNRPEARNALTSEMKRRARESDPARSARIPDVGCVLLTGAGRRVLRRAATPRGWRATASLPSPEERKRLLRWEHGIPLALHRLEKPTLAALPGPAAGAGFSLALACDLRIAAESAFATTSYARLGLSGDYGGELVPDALVGTGARAGDPLHRRPPRRAPRCERLGLVNRVVPDAELEREATALARARHRRRPADRAPLHEGQPEPRAHRAASKSVLDLEADRMVQSAQNRRLPGGRARLPGEARAGLQGTLSARRGSDGPRPTRLRRSGCRS